MRSTCGKASRWTRRPGSRWCGELTLALQDQNVDLATLRRQAADDPDQARALAALIEGDATRVELAYLATLPAGDQAAVAGAAGPTPPARPRTGSWRRRSPATVGREFAAALAEQGGNPAVDAAFRRPPASTAQVIDPKAYQDGMEPLGVRAPPGEGQRVDAGTLGEFGLAALITAAGGRRTRVRPGGGWATATGPSGRPGAVHVRQHRAGRQRVARAARPRPGRFVASAARPGRGDPQRRSRVRLRSCA